MEIVGLDRIHRSGSFEFAGQLLPDGLRALLANVDYLMTIPDSTARIPTPDRIRVWLYSETLPIDARSADAWLPPQPAIEEPPSQPAAQDASELSDRLDADPELQQLLNSGFFDKANDSSLFQATKSENAEVRARSLKALATRDSSMSPDALGIAMSDADPAVSGVASVLMADSNAPRTLESLAGVLHHADPVLRFNALELLGRRNDPESLPYVLELLNDENDVIRSTAQQLVDRLKSLRSRD